MSATLMARLLAAGLLFTAIAGSARIGLPRQDHAAESPLLDERRAALEIDLERVPWEEFACWLVRFQGEHHAQEYARRRALERAAEEAGIRFGLEELRAIVEARVALRVEKGFGGDRDAWRAELARLGQTEEEFFAVQEERARVEAWVEALVKRRRAIGEVELRAAWERGYGPGGRSVDLRLLHLRVPPAADQGVSRDEAAQARSAARAKVEGEAQSLRARALAGEPFEELVRQHSDDPESRARGGRVPDLAHMPGWTTNALDAVRSLAVGELSEPIYARGGYNLLLVAGEEVTPFERVAAELRRTLEELPPGSGESGALLTELTSGTKLELLPELGRAVDGHGSEPQSWRLDRAVFTVGGEPVTRGVYAAWLTVAHGQPLVRAFAESYLIERAALAEGVAVSSAEVERRVREDIEQRIETYFEGEREKWRASFLQRGLSEEGHLRTLSMKARADLLAEKLMLARRVVTPEMVRQEWEQRFGSGGRNPDVRYILRQPRNPTEGEVTTQEELERHLEKERAAARELLLDLRRRIAEGEDFATLARLHSQDAETSDRGGRPAGRFELHTWPAEVQRAIAALRPGELSEPIELGLRSYLFELVGMTIVPLEEVQAELAAELARRRPAMVEIGGFVNELYKQHDVRTLPGLYEPHLSEAGADAR